MTATPEQLAFLQAINDQVNAIPYVAIGSDANKDNWIDTPEAGKLWECRDYSTRKAMLMRQQGWDHLKMGEVLCNTEPFSEHGEPAQRYYHSVEFASAGGVVYILDNRYPTVYRADQPPYDYQWVHQQIPGTEDWRSDIKALVP